MRWDRIDRIGLDQLNGVGSIVGSKDGKVGVLIMREKGEDGVACATTDFKDRPRSGLSAVSLVTGQRRMCSHRPRSRR